MARPATAAVRLLTGEREPCRLATTANIDVDAGGLLTIDGVQTVEGDRVLVKDQTDGSENGIRTVSAGQWYRAADARTARTMQKGTTVHVAEGSTNAGKTYVFNTLNPVIGDTALAIVFYQSDDGIGIINAAIAAGLSSVGSAITAGLALITAAVSAAGFPASPVANTFLQRNAGNTAYAAKTTTEVRNALAAAVYASDRTAVKALDPTKDRAATTYGEGLGRNGQWLPYLTSSLSASVQAEATADTAEGKYLTSGSYTWIRLHSGPRNASWYGVVGDGTTDDTAALTAAFAGSAVGCVVMLPPGCNPLVDTTFTMPDGATLIGSQPAIGGFTPSTTYATINRIYVNSAATISIGSNCTLKNLGIFRKGLTFNITSAQVAAQFLGTGVTIRNSVADVLIEDCLVLGFNQGIRSISGATSCSRITINRVHGDCQNGIFLEASTDITRISECHFWPFVTIGSVPETNGAQNDRTGAAFSLKAPHDWTQVRGCFSFAYATGYLVTDADQVVFLNCGADGHAATPLAGTIGFRLVNSAADIKYIGCQTAAQDIGFQSDTTSAATAPATYTACNTWECATYGFNVTSGAASFSNCQTRRTGAAASSAGWNVAATAVVDMDQCSIYGYDIGINNAVGAVTRHRGTIFSGILTGNIINPYMATLASASAVTPNAVDTVFSVSGTTGIQTINNARSYAGRSITLIFANNNTRLLGGGNIAIGTSYYCGKNEAVTLVSDGVNWFPQGDKFKKTWVGTSAPNALSNSSTSAQNIFPSTQDEINVEAATLYRFRTKIGINTGATSHTTSFGIGGTATITSMAYTAMATSTAGSTTLGTPQMASPKTASATALTAASTAIRTDIFIEGEIRVNAAGNIAPQITFSAGPTGTCEIDTDSWFEIEKVAGNASVAVGDYA
ncbi:hypothetical protein [Mesorhizobium sp. B2-1-3A]|uniref:hypothetical protein n=1 Tax=Mesorhizobium sp. B2-1-3A TaxID=2589971 RepID=UPI00112E151C|nr:hypothetical protein [Mesorhizobium sp. B2-1-3A]TPM89867.1 hypothetical protein FJ977_35415 [Mesorhizobium sp. B2-1-3A]